VTKKKPSFLGEGQSRDTIPRGVQVLYCYYQIIEISCSPIMILIPASGMSIISAFCKIVVGM
jgi:hypothetical protein